MPPVPVPVSSADTDSVFFERQRPRLKAISGRIVGSAAEAEDIVQECFLKWQAAPKTALATPAAWLTTVVQNLSIDRLRWRTRDALAVQAAMELAPMIAPDLPESGLLRRAELGEALLRLLRCLSPGERMALVLYEVFDCRHAEIAALLGTSSVNARQYLARARKRLSGQKQTELENEKLCRELIHRFQTAINDTDVPAMLALLTVDQPVLRQAARLTRMPPAPCANDACFSQAWAA